MFNFSAIIFPLDILGLEHSGETEGGREGVEELFERDRFIA